MQPKNFGHQKELMPQSDSDDGPRKTPETDPTNPLHQEALGILAPAEHAAERNVKEPGLDKKDRDRREPTL